MTDNLLYGSEALTKEENELREELRAWCQAKIDGGARPIPLQAALTIVADQMAGAWGHGGFRRPKHNSRP